MNVKRKGIPPMFDRYESRIIEGLRSIVPFKNNMELFDIHSYHLGFTDAEGHKIDPAKNMGKCLRPTLCLFTCEALGGDVNECIDAAVSLELIHNFSLIHDDIQDNDIERRHRETVWHLWGISKALVSGNTLHTLGDIANFQGEFSNEYNIAISKVLTNAYISMIIGQCEDLSFESTNDVSVERYLGMIAGKTGALIQSSIVMGALSATKNLEFASKFEEIGFLLGQAFQIRDDYLGVWGDPEITGKPIGGDIYRKKKSYPVVYGFANSSRSNYKKLTELYGKEVLNDRDVASVMIILENSGSRQAALNFIDDISGRAKKSVCDINIPDWAREEINYLIDFLATRVK